MLLITLHSAPHLFKICAAPAPQHERVAVEDFLENMSSASRKAESVVSQLEEVGNALGDMGLSLVKLSKFEDEDGTRCGHYTDLAAASKAIASSCRAAGMVCTLSSGNCWWLSHFKIAGGGGNCCLMLLDAPLHLGEVCQKQVQSSYMWLTGGGGCSGGGAAKQAVRSSNWAVSNSAGANSRPVGPDAACRQGSEGAGGGAGDGACNHGRP